MNHRPDSVKILGLDLTFKPGANMERVRQIASLLEEKYLNWQEKLHGDKSRDTLLVFLALDLADELLKTKHIQEEIQKRLDNLIEKIERSI